MPAFTVGKSLHGTVQMYVSRYKSQPRQPPKFNNYTLCPAVIQSSYRQTMMLFARHKNASTWSILEPALRLSQESAIPATSAVQKPWPSAETSRRKRGQEVCQVSYLRWWTWGCALRCLQCPSGACNYKEHQAEHWSIILSEQQADSETTAMGMVSAHCDAVVVAAGNPSKVSECC